MGLEAATYIHQLNAAWPVGASDPKGQGDDHLRTIKSALQATFPNIAGAVTVTHAQLNTVGASGISGFAAPANLISLTAGAAGVATTGLRSDCRIKLDEAIAPTWTAAHIFNQNIQVGSTDTSGNPLTINSNHASGPYIALKRSGASFAFLGNGGPLGFGVDSLALLALAGNALKFGANNTGPHLTINVDGTLSIPQSVFAANIVRSTVTATSLTGSFDVRSVQPGYSFYNTAGAVDGKMWLNYVIGNDLVFGVWNDAGNVTTDWQRVVRSAAGISSVTLTAPSINAATLGSLQDNGNSVIDVPKRAGTFARGQCSSVSAGFTLNTSDMAAGYTFSIYNDSAAAITITQGAGVTLRLSGTATTGNRTLAIRGLATIWCNSGTEAVISGAVS